MRFPPRSHSTSCSRPLARDQEVECDRGGNRRYEHTRAADGGERNREECLRACDSPTLRTKSCTAKESQLQSGRTHGSARRLEIELEGVGGKFPGRSRNY